VDFGVGQLQSRKIADPVFTTGADQQIRIHLPSRLQLAAKGGFINRGLDRAHSRATSFASRRAAWTAPTTGP